MQAVDNITQNPMMVRGLDRVLTVQRPVVLAHIQRIRRRHPAAGPDEVIRILERHYLSIVTTGGAGVGAAAVVPGLGTGLSLALSGIETAGFLETSALFAQSVAEVHGFPVTDPDRARAMVMALILGDAGADLVRNFGARAIGGGGSQNTYWADLIAKRIPQAFMGQIARRLRKAFLRRFAVSHGAGALGRMLPFGIGAVVGGAGNHLLGRKVVQSSRDAFGAAPSAFPVSLQLETAGV